MLGTTAIASIIILAFGGLLLVGLDTVGSQGRQLVRASQPEVAQAPEADERTDNKQDAQDSAAKPDEKAGAKTGEREESKGQSSKKERAGKEKSGKEKSGKEKSGKEKSGKEKSDKERASKDGKSEGSGKAKDEKAKKQGQDKKKEQKESYPPAPDVQTMSMTIPRLDMWGDTVWNSGSPSTMDEGAIKLPPTGFPWQQNANTYISAHRIGYPGTQSDKQFYALPAMQKGDAVYLTDANGSVYEYRVTRKLAVKPWENWVTSPQPGGDMVTLQTCVDSLDPSTWWDITPALMKSGPDTARLVVQAEKVDTRPA